MFTNDQQVAFDHFCNGHNLFITGEAGTGKSFLIESCINNAKSYRKSVAVTSTSGTSAILINGVTIHSYFGVGTCEEPLRNLIPRIMKNKPAHKRWFTTDVLIIDEISMMDATTFEKLEYLARSFRRSPSFFGGMQVILVGDLFQLPPVNYAKNGLLINSKSFQNEFCNDDGKGIIIQLREIVRQRDPEFRTMLSELRVGRMSPHSISLLESRICEPQNNDSGVEPTHLYSYRSDVDSINKKKLAEIASPLCTYTTKEAISGISRPTAKQIKFFKDIGRKYSSTPDELHIKVGAQVMLTKNMDFDQQLVNGSRGVVSKISWNEGSGDLETEPTVYVNFACLSDNENPIALRPVVTEIKIDEVIKVHRGQFPLILAWACTIHRSQGATLDCVKVDLSNVFEYGQTYVSLSRACVLDGLYISGLEYDAATGKLKLPDKLANPIIIEFFEQQKNRRLKV